MGAIALVGGDEFRQSCIPMDQELLRRIPTRPPRVVILPTAAAHQRPHLAAQNGIRYFKALGAVATSVMILGRKDADDHRYVDQLKEADLLDITGGDPWHLQESLRDSAV
ncbi:MAG: Type 1 glutamine amidotransferase-like domain-containing protein, partial [Chloroflexota bacterium]